MNSVLPLQPVPNQAFFVTIEYNSIGLTAKITAKAAKKIIGIDENRNYGTSVQKKKGRLFFLYLQ